MKTNLHRTILALFLLTLIAALSVTAQEVVSADTKPGEVVHFDNLHVIPSTCLAGAEADYDVYFLLPQRTFLPISKGTFTFTYPTEFNLANLYQAEISERTGALDIMVESFTVFGSQVTVDFQCKLSNSSTDLLTADPPDTTLPLLDFDVSFRGIVNAFRPDSYSLSGLTVKWRNKLVAGPDLSEPFEICSPQLSYIMIEPAEDLMLQVGDSVVFDARAFDQQGNEIPGVEFNWEIVSDNLIDIGYMVGSTFYATADGEGYVRASAQGVSALSGLITISSAVEPLLTITEDGVSPDSIYLDEPFDVSFDVSAMAFDDATAVSKISIRLEPFGGGSLSEPIADGQFSHQRLSDEIIRYSALPGMVLSSFGLSPGWYRVYVNLDLFADGTHYGLTNNYADSVYLLPQSHFAYVDGSFSPTTVASGIGTQFSFDIELSGEIPLTVYPGLSSLKLTNDTFTGSASLLPEVVILTPGTNTIRSQPIAVPTSEAGRSLAAVLNLRYSALAGIPTLTTGFLLDSVAIDIVDQQSLQIVSTSMIAPNSPKVNYGQAFFLRVEVYNPGTEAVSNIDLLVNSDGASSFDPRTTITSIAAGETVTIDIPVVAADVSGGEIYQTSLDESQIIEIPALDNSALAQIQSPAHLKLDYSLLGIEGNTIGTNDEFGLIVEVDNLGEAETSTGSYILSTGGVDFGIEDPATGEIIVDEHVNFDFSAPSEEVTAVFTFEIDAIPIDLNTLEPALCDSTSFTFEIRVESLDADLLARIEPLGSSLVLPGREREMFELSLTNLGQVSSATIALKQIRLRFAELSGESISAYQLLEASGSGFYEDDFLLTVGVSGSGPAVFTFDQFELSAGEERKIIFVAEIKPTPYRDFSLLLGSNDFEARFVDGPGAGESPMIVTDGNEELTYARSFAIKSPELEESFVIRDNPFNPDNGPAVFSYELTSPSSVDFRVFTLTGEEVFAADFPQGSAETSVGENYVEWNGANNEGDVVRNGVYIVVIQVNSSGEQARMKVAVVR